MDFRSFPLGRLVVFIFLSLLDLLLTWLLVRYSGGRVVERNPLASAWLLRYGWEGLIVFKMAAMFLVVLLAFLISLRRPRVAGWFLSFACLLVGGVAVYSYALLRNLL